jgi:hypothetical protein
MSKNNSADVNDPTQGSKLGIPLKLIKLVCDIFSFFSRAVIDGCFHVLEGLMLEAGATKGRDLRLEVRELLEIVLGMWFG